MSTFDIKQDAPGLLRAESLNIKVKFERTGPNTGRVSWNIPTPAAGCASDDQAYCGILITLDTTPISSAKTPTDGIVYSSDPTADSNLFAGDKIGTSSVIGAFYNDRTNTFFDVSGLTPNTPYYVSGFPVDCQLRYYKEGVHAYSLDYTNRGTDGTQSSQIVILNSNQPTPGVSPDDYTGLMPGITYDFQIQLGVIPSPRTPIDSVYCNPAPLTYTVPVSGTNSTTFRDLVNEINKGLTLIESSVQGPTAPNTGAYYWDATTQKLYQWNGYQNSEVPVIVQGTAPNNVTAGTYWVNPTTNVLKFWNGSNWVDVVVLTSTTDPRSPVADNTYWFDGTSGYIWNGTTWCKLTTITQSTDPSTTLPATSGSFWYDTAHNILYKWDNVLKIWVGTDAIQYIEDPNNLTPGAYWFDESSNTLYSWNIPSAGWNTQPNVSISEREPTTPAPGKFWYNPTTQELKQWNALTSIWDLCNVISFPYDPTLRNYCDLWWDTINDILFAWNGTTSTWVQVTTFYEQSTDPSLLPTIIDGTIWYNPITNQLYMWKNNCFVLVEFISYPVDPTTQLVPGVVWYNPTTNIWNVLDLSLNWALITPVSSTNDPTNLPTGTYWFNDVGNSLQLWNGVSWVSILYSTTNPAPIVGTLWFNSSTNTMMEWNGVTWIPHYPMATVELDCHGNLLFTDTTIGSLSFVNLTDGTLFKSLQIPFTFNTTKPGTDGISNQPSYNEIGIGTDGSNDQRLLLMNEIRYEFGYPVIDVELTNEQLDYCITRALNELRAKSGLGYKRGFFFMQTAPETQRYILTNKVGEFNKIVDIMGIYRLTSAFLSSAHGAGVYGQIVLQHLYNMGTFDLLSYHIITEYVKTMEILFAARLTFTWNEQTRELWIHHRFPYTEPYVAVEASVERTEQDIISDRYSRPWIRRYATALARVILAEIRGKFSTLPGAGGNITLNANDLRVAAKEELEACLAEIYDFVADKPEEYGMASTLIFG